ncbi:MAG TPA: hypothetical protein VM324_07660 [Egibacteraceae bacterium]|jgi:hypothetical protein|nr:hypothetical protein [Egibacteraceae bacterium]
MVAQAFSDCGQLAAALARRLAGRPVTGSFNALPCDVGGRDGRSTARRVLMTVGTSLQPNSYVVGFDHEDLRGRS